ncbi:hypothetical protein ACQP1K_20285 [Sphaerimonospora sp. CA-214678]|uniref:hypothetical protein n=1 Tax=Sphaerimonospora sp. CA-214678 TaxID=3240029 RepID=UPI003D8AFF8D
MTFPPDDEYGESLRRALRAEADSVVPSPEGLEIIRARIARRGVRNLFWWRVGASFAGAVLVAGATVMIIPDLRTQVVESTGLSQTTSVDDGERDTSSMTRPPAATRPPAVVVPSVGGTRIHQPSPTPVTSTPTPQRTWPSPKPSPSSPSPCPSPAPDAEPHRPGTAEAEPGATPPAASSCPPVPTAQPPASVPVPTITTATSTPHTTPSPHRPAPPRHSPVHTPTPTPTPTPDESPAP